ncbi:MAG: VOC family protein, partial [Candidatus Binatia bacterium]
MAIRGAALGHVVLNVCNLERSERFYRSILRMKLSGRNQRTRMSFLSFGKEHHDIALAEIPSGEQRAAEKGIPGLHHFSVYVKTAEEVDA